MKRMETSGRPVWHARLAVALLAIVAIIAACDSPTDPAVPGSLEPISALVQNAEAGELVAVAPAVRLLDQRGRPMPGEPVIFEVVAGGGEVGASSLRLTMETDAAGEARVASWKLGEIVGPNELVARVGGLPDVRFTASAQAGPVAKIDAQEWATPSGRVMEAVAGEPVVRVADRHGNPVSGAAVLFIPAGGSVTQATAVTNANGIASAGAWTLGPVAGEQTLRASAGEFAVELRALAQPGAAAVLEIGAGNGQTATVGTTVKTSPAVIVKDAYGNRTAVASVAFDVVAGGGTIGNTQGVLASNSFTQDVDALGNASVAQWTLGMRSGLNRLRATLAGTTVTVTFDAQGVAGAAVGMSIFEGNSQSGSAGSTLPVAPAVLVTDVHGNGVPNIAVIFTVSAGGGALVGGATTTNGAGVAAVGSWRLGAAGTNSLDATSPGLSGVTFQATASSAPGTGGGSGGSGGSGGGFDIEIRFAGTVDGGQQAVFQSAAGRWAGAITGDLPSVPLSVAAGACGVPHPALNEVVDDLIIYVAVSTIDGPGKILGSAGPCFIRSGGLPVLGVMFLDAADVSQMQSNGTLEAVVAHEIGHVLGVGTMWGGLVMGAGSSDPYFVGGSAVAAFLASGGSSYPGNPVPVENTGGAGTRDSHWRESVFGAELMTGWINGGAIGISQVTLGSLVDLGYTVNLNTAGGFGAGLGAHGAGDDVRIELREGPPLVTPVTVDSRGRRILPVQR